MMTQRGVFEERGQKERRLAATINRTDNEFCEREVHCEGYSLERQVVRDCSFSWLCRRVGERVGLFRSTLDDLPIVLRPPHIPLVDVVLPGQHVCVREGCA